MPPNTQQNGSDPYGFIMNSPPKPPRKPLVDGSSMGMRIAIVAGGLFLLLIVAIIVSSFLGKASRAQTDKMIDVATEQSEIIRVTGLAEKKISSSSTLDYAVTTRMSVQSSDSSLAQQLAKRGIKEKKLAALKKQAVSSKADKLLEDAASKNRYDETYTQLINEALARYQLKLQAAAGGATKSEKEVLRIAWEGVETLKKNDPSAAAANNSPTTQATEDKPKSSVIDNDLGASQEE